MSRSDWKHEDFCLGSGTSGHQRKAAAAGQEWLISLTRDLGVREK